MPQPSATRMAAFGLWMFVTLAQAASPAVARDIYVSTTGNDGWTGTAAQPYRTIKTAIARAAYGDTIRVRAGTYNEGWIEVSSGLTLVSEDGPRAAKIHSGNASGLRFVGVSDCEARGFECMANYGQGNPGDGLVRIYNSHNIRLRNMLIHDASYDCDCVKIGGYGTSTTSILVENCVIYDPAPTAVGGRAECIDAHPVDGLTVRGCWLYHTPERPGDVLMYVKGGSRNVVWENNVFGPVYNYGANSASVSAGGLDSQGLTTVDGLIARNNLFLECAGDAAFGMLSARNVEFCHNVIWNYRGGRAAIDFWTIGAGSTRNAGLRFYNNILHTTNGRPAFSDRGDYTPTAFEHDYNLYWQIGDGGAVDITAEPHSQVGVDPQLTAPAGAVPAVDDWAAIVRRFRLEEGSPAVDAGCDLPALAPTDIRGEGRPYADAADIGAHEFVLPGDVDRDREVSVLDIVAAVTRFGTTPADPEWDTRCDVDEDEQISVLDIVVVVTRFGSRI